MKRRRKRRNRMEKVVKIFDVSEKGIGKEKRVSKEEAENLRGKIIILNPEQSEIAKNLGIKEKGVYGTRFR